MSKDFTGLEILVSPRGIVIIFSPNLLRLSVAALLETGRFKLD
jgi:hypothetical protein